MYLCLIFSKVDSQDALVLLDYLDYINILIIFVSLVSLVHMMMIDENIYYQKVLQIYVTS